MNTEIDHALVNADSRENATSLKVYCSRPESVNFGDKILSPGGYVERDAISLTAGERERSFQGSKDVEKNSHFQAGCSIVAKLLRPRKSMILSPFLEASKLAHFALTHHT